MNTKGVYHEKGNSSEEIKDNKVPGVIKDRFEEVKEEIGFNIPPEILQESEPSEQ